MDGITDAPMRAFLGSIGRFSYAVSEFVRVSGEPLSAAAACRAGATAIDINFGCPAPTVNRHDGGATLLKHPPRIRELVAAVRTAVPGTVPVSAKLRLGWDSIDAIDENAAMAAEGGASWITIHARTRTQAYLPPVYWRPIGRVREALGIPVVANGDIWTLDDFRRCEDETGCRHFMIGRSALASPGLSGEIAEALGIGHRTPPLSFPVIMKRFVDAAPYDGPRADMRTLAKLKQWLKLAERHGDFRGFDAVKRSDSVAELLERLDESEPWPQAAATLLTP